MRKIKTLGRLAMRVYTNPCDENMINEFGIGHSYCYYLEFANVLNKDINEKCDCDTENTCKSAQGKYLQVDVICYAIELYVINIYLLKNIIIYVIN